MATSEFSCRIDWVQFYNDLTFICICNEITSCLKGLDSLTDVNTSHIEKKVRLYVIILPFSIDEKWWDRPWDELNL